MGDHEFSLAAEFEPMDRQKWRPLAEAALKGKPLDKLIRQINGLTVEPLYTRADRSDRSEGLPGSPPFVRGAGSGRPPWAIQQVYASHGPDTVNQAIVTDLERGVTAVEIDVDGCRVQGLEDLNKALIGVHDDLAPIGVSAEGDGPAAATLLLALWAQRRRDPAQQTGYLNLDPIGDWASGHSSSGLDAGLEALADIAGFVQKNWPRARTARVDGARYHDAGAAEIDEIATTLATGVAYLEAMTAASLSVPDAARQIVLRVAVDADLFVGVAKLRALRQTWARVLTAAGAEAAVADVRIDATTSRAMMTERDPWVNILRSTVAGFAAAVGEASAIHVRPFDEAVGVPDDLARRIARNTQVILQDESHLDQVIDPAGGSWHVEDLTRQLAEAAWSQFQALQASGGVISALNNGLIQDRIDRAWAQRSADIARRKQPITGVSEFPNLAEARLERPKAARSPEAASTALDWAPNDRAASAVRAALDGAARGTLSASWRGAAGAGAAVPRPIAPRARAAGFEALRAASDRFFAANGRRPQVLLVKLGPLAEHTARVTYTKNFFEAGGIEAIDGDPVTGPEAAAAAVRAHPSVQLAAICGTDTRYADEASAVAGALKNAGVRAVYLAGRPQDLESSYREGGVDEFIHLGVDVLDVLQRAMGALTERS